MHSTGIHPTRHLSKYVKNLEYKDLSVHVIEYTKLLVLDYLASAMAGYKVNKVFNKYVLDVFGGMGGKQESSILFGGGQLPASTAALINAVYGHGADLDDGHRTAQGHPGVTVIPTILALAEANDVSGEDVITAIVAGYDVYVRLSNAVMPSHFLRGFHGTGTIGSIAAGAAAAKIMGLSEEGVERSISLAAVQASGLFEVSESGQMAKPINAGNATRTGIISALLAKAGSDAPKDPLEGKKGFFKAFTDKVDLDFLFRDLGEKYEITTCYIKLYPACRHAHAPVDVALKLRKNGLPSLDMIEKVKIYTYPAAINVVGNILEPVSADEAKFSMTYSTATALLTGKFTLEDLEKASCMSDEVRTMIRRMEIISEPELENRACNIRGSRVEIIMTDGTVRTEAVILPKGDPEVPLEDGDMREKLRFCAKDLYNEETQQTLYDTAMRLNELSHISELLRTII